MQYTIIFCLVSWSVKPSVKIFIYIHKKKVKNLSESYEITLLHSGTSTENNSSRKHTNFPISQDEIIKQKINNYAFHISENHCMQDLVPQEEVRFEISLVSQLL